MMYLSTSEKSFKDYIPSLLILKMRKEIGGDTHSDLMQSGNVARNLNERMTVKNFLRGVNIGMHMQN